MSIYYPNALALPLLPLLLFLSLASLGRFAMEKFHVTQCAKIILIVLLLLITPLLSSSVRTPYLYFLFNLLLLVLGVESGILTAISRPPEDNRKTSKVSDVTANYKLVANDNVSKVAPFGAEEESTAVVEKTISVVKKMKPKKCPSTPSLFFIGGFDGEDDADQNGVDEGDEEEEGLSGQELFAKAETFIGNFYKELKIQREESWRRIHGFYHKAF